MKQKIDLINYSSTSKAQRDISIKNIKGILGNQKVNIRKSHSYPTGILGGKDEKDEKDPIYKEKMGENVPELKKGVIRFMDHTKSQAK